MRVREPRPKINENIRSRDVRLVDGDGKQDVLTTQRALELAREQGLDLVEVASNADPPVCRIMDYGKFRYQQRKKASESKKKQSRVQMKEVKLGSKTAGHDVDFKVSHIRKFLSEGMRIKISVFFRGRAITHPEKGREMLALVMSHIEDVAAVELQPRMEGRTMTMTVIPK